MKKVSVVISNYNYARFLREALDSVLAQSHPGTEIIVVDDGSTDGSVGILREYEKKHSSIALVLQENSGQGSAMNAGIGLSTGDVVLFMDSDDTWHPNKIQTVLPLLEEYGFVQHNLVCGDKLYRSFLINRDHQRYMLEFGLFDFFVPTSGLCLRRDIVEKVFPLPDDDMLRICADAYISRLSLCYSSLATISEPLGMYRVHGANNWTRNSKRTLDKVPNIIKLVNRRLEERGEQRIPLERNWIWYGPDAVEIGHSLAVLNELKAQPGHEVSATALEGYLYLALGRYDEAIEDFMYAIKNWENLNSAYCMGKEMKSIVEIEGRKKKQASSLNKVYHRLGQCLEVTGNSSEALDVLQKGIEGASDAMADADGISPKEMANTYYHMAVCYVRLKRYEDALEAFAGVLENDPDRLEIYLNRSDSLRYLGRFEEALAEVEKAEAINPNFPNLTQTRQKVFRVMPGSNNAPAGKENHVVEPGYNVQIQTTSVCNGKCIFCPYMDSWHKEHPGMMTDGVFERIVDQLKSIPLNKICMYLENEPLVDPQLIPRTKRVIDELSFNLMEISTNAALLTEEKARSLVELFGDSPHQIWLSFHGINKRTFEGVMGLDFEKTLDNVIRLLQLAQDVPLNITIRGAGMPLVKSLGHPYTFSEAEYREFWTQQCLRHGISRLPAINYFKYHDRCRAIKRNDIRLKNNIRNSLKGFYCPRVDSWLHFLYTGELCICCMDYHREQIFGDITTHTVEEIFKSESYLNLRNQAFGLKESPENFICKRCLSPNG